MYVSMYFIKIILGVSSNQRIRNIVYYACINVLYLNKFKNY